MFTINPDLKFRIGRHFLSSDEPEIEIFDHEQWNPEWYRANGYLIVKSFLDGPRVEVSKVAHNIAVV